MTDSHWFPLTDLILVTLSGVAWMINPDVAIWLIPVALLPWLLRLLAGKPPFRRTLFDWPMALFLITTWVGYWASFDKAAAWGKAWLIVLAVLLYYALCAQPRRNIVWISILSFFIGVGISSYFYLTQDFSGGASSLGQWWMHIRPTVGWSAVHHSYISGVLVITSMIAAYGLLQIKAVSPGRLLSPVVLIFLPGLAIVAGAFVLTLSRGILLALGSAAAVWVLWKVLDSNRVPLFSKMKPLFPHLTLAFLALIVLLVSIRPERLDYDASRSEYGKNTRSEVFLRSVYFLEDFPITGGGLNSFPGLYSEFVLRIPVYYFANTYNMFLDVAIEQGVVGGSIFLFLYFGSVWLVARRIAAGQSPEMRTFHWLTLFALVVAVVHGILYDYLYNGAGAFLLFFPIGTSMLGLLPASAPAAIPFTARERARAGMLTPSVLPVIAIVALLLVNFERVASVWYSNLGAVRMDQVELAGFPTGHWMEPTLLPDLRPAEAALHSALQFDPANWTANYRLGLLSMFQADFVSAVRYLDLAHGQTPAHRGIIKSLGYCYVWSGDAGKALSLLEKIPEARNELGVYAWWWGKQGRDDLAAKAATMALQLEETP